MKHNTRYNDEEDDENEFIIIGGNNTNSSDLAFESNDKQSV